MNKAVLNVWVNIEDDVVNKFVLIFEGDFMIVEIEVYFIDHLIKFGGELCVLVLEGRRKLIMGQVEGGCLN